ncbi:hypothetical protein JB92DRAFT_2013738 [Gautieria morchelliformis]|nr:hypothetical protein JB92DRAFT_2013738 [Gautieria morchelliformis]
MLSLLTCSVSRLDDLDSFDVAPPLRQRRVSRSLGFIKPTSPGPKRRRVSKMTIGHPTDFRHEFHLGKDMVPEDMISVWDSERWQQALEKESPHPLPSAMSRNAGVSHHRNESPFPHLFLTWTRSQLWCHMISRCRLRQSGSYQNQRMPSAGLQGCFSSSLIPRDEVWTTMGKFKSRKQRRITPSARLLRQRK